MPELPEVQTTVNGLNKHIVGLVIRDVWSNYDSKYFSGSETIKDLAYYKKFRELVLDKKVLSVTRRAKNILIHLSGNQTILVHMKMTGHLLYGKYMFNGSEPRDPWEPIEPESLKDPCNRKIRFVLIFNNGKQLALSDVRRFAKVTVIETDAANDSIHLLGIGPEPLDPSFTFEMFCERLTLRPNGKIKQVLTDQTVLAGIGNIYADESLWRAHIHPMEKVASISPDGLKTLFKAIKQTLTHGIDFGGDSTSDYRNVLGEKGGFHETHRAYQQTGMKCTLRGCKGTIERIVVGGRSTHFCNVHQSLRMKRQRLGVK